MGGIFLKLHTAYCLLMRCTLYKFHFNQSKMKGILLVYQSSFLSISASVRVIFQKLDTVHSLHILNNPCKCRFVPSVMKGTLLRKEVLFSLLSRLLYNRSSLHFISWNKHACAVCFCKSHCYTSIKNATSFR